MIQMTDIMIEKNDSSDIEIVFFFFLLKSWLKLLSKYNMNLQYYTQFFILLYKQYLNLYSA